jgi:hypothetical protein
MNSRIRSLIKAVVIGGPLFLSINHDLFSVSNPKSARVRGREMFPVLNPFLDSSSGWLEDDYVLVRILGDSFQPKSIRGKLVRVTEDDEQVIRRVEAVEGEWSATGIGFSFVQSGHAWVRTNQGEGYSVLYRQVPLALIDGVVEAVVWPPDRIRTLQ